MIGDNGLNGRPCAGKRHRDHVEMLRELEALGKQVPLGPDAAMSVVLIRPRFQIRDQFPGIVGGHGRMHGDHVR